MENFRCNTHEWSATINAAPNGFSRLVVTGKVVTFPELVPVFTRLPDEVEAFGKQLNVVLQLECVEELEPFTGTGPIKHEARAKMVNGGGTAPVGPMDVKNAKYEDAFLQGDLKKYAHVVIVGCVGGPIPIAPLK